MDLPALVDNELGTIEQMDTEQDWNKKVINEFKSEINLKNVGNLIDDLQKNKLIKQE